VSPFAVVLLVAAVVLIVASQWPRLSHRFGLAGRSDRQRARRKSRLRVVDSGADDDFIRAVERDLAALPTTDEQDARNR
jgi:hypothetical protein